MFEETMESYQLSIVSVVSIKIYAPLAASIVFRAGMEFMYKGNLEEDYATITMVITLHEGQPKISNLHRSISLNVNDLHRKTEEK